MKTSINLEITFFSFHKNLVKIALFLIIFLAGIIFSYHFWLHSQSLEEVINDQKIWQEVKDLSIPSEEIDKLIGEIIGIKSKIRKGDPCDQYVLFALKSGWYNCIHSPNKQIF
ncbi:MAG: hypothetical protein EAZ97_12115 [Bacteroidetes bacterium]|nr:MAG: hypothetical protein EAZ97_12115 [Bacteroidota bacterium]